MKSSRQIVIVILIVILIGRPGTRLGFRLRLRPFDGLRAFSNGHEPARLVFPTWTTPPIGYQPLDTGYWTQATCRSWPPPPGKYATRIPQPHRGGSTSTSIRRPATQWRTETEHHTHRVQKSRHRERLVRRSLRRRNEGGARKSTCDSTDGRR